MKNIKSKVAAIIVTYNNADIIEECIDSLKFQTHSIKAIYVVDNNSTDKTTSLIKRKFPEIKLIINSKNTGFAEGNNIGVGAAIRDPEISYFVLLNSDARLKNNWVETLMKFAEIRPNLASAQSVTLDYFNHKIIDSTHIYINRDSYAIQANYGKLYKKQLQTHKVFGVNAAAAIFSRKFVESQPNNKLFDEDLFMYLEDVDVSLRAIVTGWDNWFVSGTEAYHMGSASSKKLSGFAIYMTYRNSILILVKNLPLPILIRTFPNAVKADVDVIRYLKLKNENNLIKNVVKGRLAGLLMVGKFLIKRRRIIMQKQIPNDLLWYMMQPNHFESIKK